MVQCSPMDAFELHTPQGKPTGIFACYKCRLVRKDRKDAEQCCLPRICECGTIVQPRAFLKCSQCRQKESARRYEERWAKAIKISIDKYDGPIYDDEHDQFFSDADALYTMMQDEDYVPGHLYPCHEISLRIYASDVVYHALEDHHSEADVPHHEIERLQDVLDAWTASQSVASWEPDHTRGLYL